MFAGCLCRKMLVSKEFSRSWTICTLNLRYQWIPCKLLRELNEKTCFIMLWGFRSFPLLYSNYCNMHRLISNDAFVIQSFFWKIKSILVERRFRKWNIWNHKLQYTMKKLCKNLKLQLVLPATAHQVGLRYATHRHIK